MKASRFLMRCFVFATLASSEAADQRRPWTRADEEKSTAEGDPFRVEKDPNGTPYFPEGEESYYTKHLRAMGEPSLLKPDSNVHAIRFTWLRAFHKPIVIRVTAKNGKWTLHAIKMNGRGGNFPGEAQETKDLVLTKEQGEAVVKEEASVMKVAAILKRNAETGAMDGSRWIVEIQNGHVCTQLPVWSPKLQVQHSKEFGISDEVRTAMGRMVWLCEMLLRFSQLDSEGEIY